jgi:multidrug resistance efflux pump
VAKQQAELQQAEYADRLMTLKSPVDGKIVRLNTMEGMSFGQQTRKELMQIQPDGKLIIRAEVDQEFASRVEKGQQAIIQDDGNPNLKWTGTVLRVSEAFLPKRSGSMVPEGLPMNDKNILECIVSVDSGDSNTPIRHGQRVRVSIGVE